MKSKYLVIIVVLSFICLGVPYIIENYLVVEGDLVNNSVWIQFFSNYYGSLIGFLGVIITIYYTKKQYMDEKRNNSIPFLNISEIEGTNYQLNKLKPEILKSRTTINIKNDNIISQPNNYDISKVIKFENIGNGHLLKFRLKLSGIDIFQVEYNDEEVAVNSEIVEEREHSELVIERDVIEKNENIELTFYVRCRLEQEMDHRNKDHRNNYKIVIKPTFLDMHQNYYQQTIILFFKVKASIRKGDVQYYGLIFESEKSILNSPVLLN